MRSGYIHVRNFFSGFIRAFRFSPAPRGHRPPTGGKTSCFRPASGVRVFFRLLSASRERRCCSEQMSCSGCRGRLVTPTEMRRDREPSQVRQVIGRIATRLSAAHFVHANRTSRTSQAIFRLPQAAGPSFPLLSFWPKARRNKAPETKERRGSRTLLSVCALTALPSHQQHHISSNCREAEQEQGERQ